MLTISGGYLALPPSRFGSQHIPYYINSGNQGPDGVGDDEWHHPLIGGIDDEPKAAEEVEAIVPNTVVFQFAVLVPHKCRKRQKR